MAPDIIERLKVSA